MKHMKTVLTALIVVIGVATGVAVAQTCRFTSAGCSNNGGTVVDDEDRPHCSRGTGTCHDCEYNCENGNTEYCSHTASRSVCSTEDAAGDQVFRILYY